MFLARRLCHVLVVAYLAAGARSTQKNGVNGKRTKKGTHFLHKVLEDYDNRIPPNFDDDSSTVVECNIFISSFDSISEQTMDFFMTIFLRQKWMDTRLNYEHLSQEPVVTLDSRLVSEIWVPDLFFTNEKRAHFHDVTVPNQFLRIYRNGTIHYSVRLSLQLSCPMKLHKFPLDTQKCYMQIESYAYTTDKLMFVWKDQNPVEMAQNLELPQFQLQGYKFKDCTKAYSTGDFTCLQVDFVLLRDVGFYMIQTYVPSALVVILSWVSFWISIDAVPARISLGVLTILTMTTQSTGMRQSMPRVSYIKAIDVWMATCLIFVFAALLEFAIVNVLSRKEIRRQVTIRRRPQPLPSTENGVGSGGGEDDEGDQRPEKSHRAAYQRDPDGKHKARTVDKYARKLFPAAFVAFNAIYWTSYVMWKYNEGE